MKRNISFPAVILASEILLKDILLSQFSYPNHINLQNYENGADS